MSVELALNEASTVEVASPILFAENEVPEPIIEENNNINNEIKVNHPKDNWEVAYVYAFLLKFTDLQSTTSLTSILFTALTLEEELLSSSPPNIASPVLADVPSTSTTTSTTTEIPISSSPPPSPLLIQIIQTLQSYLPNAPSESHSRLRKDWLGWIFRWVKTRLLERHAGGLRWWEEGRGNLLKKVGVKSGMDKDEAFWDLEWEDKIHLLRCIVDWTLTYSPTIRTEISQAFDIGHQRTLKRTYELNNLVIEPLGKLRGKTLWHLGEGEGRLYLCGSGEDEFSSVSGTKEEFKTYFEGLKKEEVDEEEEAAKEEEDSKPKDKKSALNVSGDPFSKAREAAKKRKAVEKAKLKKVVISPAEIEEMKIRKVLEDRFRGVEKGEESLLALTVKKLRAAERAEQKASGSTSRSIDHAAFTYRPPSSRSTRLRTQTTKIDYVYSSPPKKSRGRYRSEEEEIIVDAGNEEESGGSESDEEIWNGKGKGKGKRSRKDKSFAADDDQEGDGSGMDSDGSSTRRDGKRRKQNGSPEKFESKGERRSSRHQKVEVIEEIEMLEPAYVEPASIEQPLVSPVVAIVKPVVVVEETIVIPAAMEVKLQNGNEEASLTKSTSEELKKDLQAETIDGAIAYTDAVVVKDAVGV